ncbi:propionyl-CoA synthetase [Ponticoccus sp. SC2-23]|uniref:propionyl-CoA synthetase n=1 Tax=Alexandriicola marinus TaxID=2081710 RepID=UPI000FDA61B0|nr:propionyl-CoA synthetase [Alexandriicola marinus]MBM1221213.1 propionyl-CoA synthetase [Ponticoccus sp. SC6-9]MBM1225783.1 propionyl-CoA synthetase [Ponticoccus sp. SC6-15]MBM1227935.1 propionyl-CoA synthetase [Ponticoccus sp. SC6-38]MBM1234427.1 propionyl-CoA synthetase [Ponticoccus sp. SC6-45]MBM1238437.1 propionyl-CoA synthetase [Ponticoccus sp. SC6-49]MBM1243706.1 propionyl-CoA synthetase [Ponticoccus sp. SC2-64]MBM1247951.1 propionyl-CoA synthetase [Ponticoccus sp. SC6-42]MBM1252837
MGYRDVYEAWKADPEAFWMAQAEQIDWDREPTRALNDTNAPLYEWYTDGMVNTCWNAVDRHVAGGRADQVAIIHDSPVTGTVTRITYAELKDRVASLAGALAAKGVTKGDRVVIYMPMVPEALVAMLACTRIGAIHSVVFGGFAANELAVRIDDATPKAVIAGSCGIEGSRIIEYKPLLDAAIEQATHKPDFTIVFQRDQARASMIEGRDFDWAEVTRDATPADCVPVEGNHPAYILYTSGTTGAPKGVVRPTAGHLVALNWTMKAIYNVEPGDVFWAASDVGWVVGHSYICYAPLVHGNTTIVFEGKPVGTPDAGTFWRVIADHKVKSFFTAPTAFRAIKREDPKGELIANYDISSLQALYLAGERADPDTIEWAQRVLNVPVYDHWWQTETGYTIAGNPAGIEALPVKIGSPTVAMPGYDVQILDEAGHPVKPGELGAIAVKLPLPPGTLPTLWNAEDRFRKSYLNTFPGYYETGDAGMMDEDGYLWIMARTDDVINVAGHRLSTGGMEEVLAGHPDVAECAVIGVKDELKGQLPMGFLCLNAGCDRPVEEIVAEEIKRVRDQIGPVAAFKLAVVVDRLPKTRSGKILRGIMARIADGEAYKMPATIDDPAILDEIRDAVTTLGYAKG